MTDALAAARAGDDLPSRARVALRERPLMDVLDLTIRFCASHAAAYAKVSLVVVVPAFALSLVAAHAGGWALGWAVALGLSALADAPFVALASRLVFTDRVRARDVVRLSGRALPGIAGARLAQVTALVVSAPFLGLPWLWVGPHLFFVVEVLVLEQPAVRAAVVRAARIGAARFGEALSAMVLLLLVRLAFTAVADLAGRELLQGLLELKAPAPLSVTGGSWLALVGWWSAVPLVASARFLVYLDVRTRTEGWDIQTRFAAIAAAGRGGASP
jgi:hypothetical protein